MQIILVQTEVEDAIKDYISKKLTVAPNTEIQIDLAATRGTEGVKAIIDLVPAGAAKAAVVTPTPAPAAITTRKTATPKTETPATPAPQATQKAATPAPVAEIAAETVAAAAEPTEDEPQQGEAEGEVEAAPEPPPATPVKSLFANLQKPVNR